VKESPYYKQAELMLKTIPHVAAERSFALKGGTAINLFVRDMPRLSVDIDLTYLPVGDARDAALRNMSAALDRIAGAIKKSIPGTRVQETRAKNPDRITRITVAVGSTRIKIDPNAVIRGSVYPAGDRDLTRRAEDLFELSVTARDTETSIEVDIAGADRDILLDRRGEALNALQYLLNRIVYRGRGGKKIHLDSGGYRRDREDEIVEIARRAADAAKTRGKEQLLSPLNPYERRLVHLALAEIDGVTTRSVGDGFLKRVAVVPTGPGTKRSDR